jgi:1-deoxy-D-xylulose 5-phosphate reductoisomerase
LAAGGASSAILHSANEVAVAKFLDGKIDFTDIFDTIEYVCGSLNGSKVKMDLDSVLRAVNDAASLANEFVSRK